MVFVRTVLLIAVLLLGWVALRGGLHPSAAAVPAPVTLPTVPTVPTMIDPVPGPAQPPA